MEGHSQYPSELVKTMESLRDLVAIDEDLDGVAQRMCLLAVDAVDGAERCSISHKTGDKIVTIGATDDAATRIDQLQYETKEGPCLSSIEDFEMFSIPVMEEDDTWPAFSKRAAAETKTQSMLSFVLNRSRGQVGALNMSATKRDAFGEDDFVIGALFAAQAAVVLTYVITHGSDRLELEQLAAALASRDVIGKAVGITMASQKVDSERAFEILVRISQTTNEKLRDIAGKLVERAADI